MNLDELVPMPEPAGVLNTGTMALRAFTSDQMRAHSEAVAAAVAKRCADLCRSEMVNAEETARSVDYAYNDGCEDSARAIRREFGEVSNG